MRAEIITLIRQAHISAFNDDASTPIINSRSPNDPNNLYIQYEFYQLTIRKGAVTLVHYPRYVLLYIVLSVWTLAMILDLIVGSFAFVSECLGS